MFVRTPKVKDSKSGNVLVSLAGNANESGQWAFLPPSPALLDPDGVSTNKIRTTITTVVWIVGVDVMVFALSRVYPRTTNGTIWLVVLVINVGYLHIQLGEQLELFVHRLDTVFVVTAGRRTRFRVSFFTFIFNKCQLLLGC